MSLSYKTILFLAITLAFGLMGPSARGEVRFTRDIAPILLKRCTGCHGERANLGGYRAQTFQNLTKPGASGRASITPGKPDDSRLFQLISAKSEAVRMPRSDDPLSPEQIQLFRNWILEGAKFDGADPTASLKALLGPRRHPAAPTVYRAPIPVLALAFAPGGKEIAVGGYNEVTFWNATTGALTRRITHLPQRIQSLTFSRDGKRMLVAGGTPGEYGEAAFVDLATGERTKILDSFGDIALATAISPNGKWVAVGGADASVQVYDASSGKRLWVSKVHSDWVTSVSFSYDNRFLASASKDMTIKLYEAGTGTLYTTYNGHNRQIGAYQGQAPIYAVRFFPNAPLACSAGGGKWIQIWDPVKTKAEAGDAGDMEERFAKRSHARYIAHGFAHEVFALGVYDGQVFAASADGVLKQFDLTSLQETRAYNASSDDWLFALDYDPATRRIATGSYSGEVRVWDTRTGRCLCAFRAQPGASGIAGPYGRSAINPRPVLEWLKPHGSRE